MNSLVVFFATDPEKYMRTVNVFDHFSNFFGMKIEKNTLPETNMPLAPARKLAQKETIINNN